MRCLRVGTRHVVRSTWKLQILETRLILEPLAVIIPLALWAGSDAHEFYRPHLNIIKIQLLYLCGRAKIEKG
jgi:hypothetical protein